MKNQAKSPPKQAKKVLIADGLILGIILKTGKPPSYEQIAEAVVKKYGFCPVCFKKHKKALLKDINEYIDKNDVPEGEVKGVILDFLYDLDIKMDGYREFKMTVNIDSYTEDSMDLNMPEMLEDTCCQFDKEENFIQDYDVCQACGHKVVSNKFKTI